MDNKIKKNQNCDECATDFRNEINELVDSVKGYSEEDRMKKKEEVEKAFEEKKNK